MLDAGEGCLDGSGIAQTEYKGVVLSEGTMFHCAELRHASGNIVRFLLVVVRPNCELRSFKRFGMLRFNYRTAR